MINCKQEKKTVTYEKILEIEIINELNASIYAKMLNYVLKNNLEKKDRTTLQSNLLNQLSVMKQIDLFSLSLDKLKYYHEYLLATKKYAEVIT